MTDTHHSSFDNASSPFSHSSPHLTTNNHPSDPFAPSPSTHSPHLHAHPLPHHFELESATDTLFKLTSEAFANTPPASPAIKQGANRALHQRKPPHPFPQAQQKAAQATSGLFDELAREAASSSAPVSRASTAAFSTPPTSPPAAASAAYDEQGHQHHHGHMEHIVSAPPAPPGLFADIDVGPYDSCGGGMMGGNGGGAMDLGLFCDAGDMMGGAAEVYSSEEAMRASLAWIDAL